MPPLPHSRQKFCLIVSIKLPEPEKIMLRIIAPIIKIIMPLIRVFMNPRFLFPLIAIWYKAPNPHRAIKDFLIQNSFASGIFYGLMTAVSLILTYKEKTLIYGFDGVLFPILSVLFLLVHAFLVLLFGRVHYPMSKRINWHKTIQPIKDLFIVWGVTVIFSGSVFLFILLISK